MSPTTALRRLAGPAATVCLIALLGPSPASAANTPKRPVTCGSPGVIFRSDESEPKELAEPLASSVLADFAVFRRAPLPTDQPPILSPAGKQLDYQLSSYYPGYVRRIAELSDGSRFFVIPAQLQVDAVPPVQCLPKSLRPQRAKIVEEQRKRAGEPVYCIVKVGSPAGVETPDCVPFGEVEQSPNVFASGFTGGPTVDLVPDGVASVRIVYSSVAPILASVSENAFVFTPPKALTSHLREVLKKVIGAAVHARSGKPKHLTKAQERRLQSAFERALQHALAQAEPTRVEWLDGSGALLRKIGPPSSSFGAPITPIAG